jgi:hypothetical protein
MNGKWWSIAVLVAVAGMLLGVDSCGHSQQLVSIQVQPSTETFGSSTTLVIDNFGAQVQLRALGTYIHPPVTKDITNQVTWSSNTPQMFTVDATTGMLTATGESCGGTLISATVTTGKSAGGISSSGAVVTGFMTANVVCFTGTGGGSGNPLLSVTFLGAGIGTVSDPALGFSCSTPGPCSTQAFASGTSITLTATPSSTSTFGGWSMCPTSPTSNVCAFTLSGNPVVTVTFN